LPTRPTSDDKHDPPDRDPPVKTGKDRLDRLAQLQLDLFHGNLGREWRHGIEQRAQLAQIFRRDYIWARAE
jgi:hypothetical protein